MLPGYSPEVSLRYCESAPYRQSTSTEPGGGGKEAGLHGYPSVPHFPEEDSKLRATSLRVRRGGNCPNTVEVLQQLLRHGSTEPRVVPHLVSCLPAAGSAATSKILSSFGDDTPADFSHCLYREGHTEPASSYIIQSQTAGTRTIVNYSDLPEMTVQEFGDIADNFRDQPGSWWHFEVSLAVRQPPC